MLPRRSTSICHHSIPQFPPNIGRQLLRPTHLHMCDRAERLQVHRHQHYTLRSPSLPPRVTSTRNRCEKPVSSPSFNPSPYVSPRSLPHHALSQRQLRASQRRPLQLASQSPHLASQRPPDVLSSRVGGRRRVESGQRVVRGGGGDLQLLDDLEQVLADRHQRTT